MTSPDTMRDERSPTAHARDDAWRDRPFDEVHDAALESFPASDPPSWSPIRVGVPATDDAPVGAAPGRGPTAG